MRCKSLENKDLKHKKGLWSPDEDRKLIDYIMNHGLGCWSAVPINAGLQRNGKSCRLRWTNYLRPGLKRGMFTTHEEEIILTLHGMLGNKWSQMSQHLPGRSDNEIKNHWHSHLKKKFANVGKVKTQPTSLDTSNKESSYTSSLKSTRRDSSLESSRHMEGLSADPGLFDYPKEASRRIPPKILFADWLSPGQFHEYDNSGELSVSRDVFLCTSSSQETTINGGSYTSNIQERSRASNLKVRPEHQHAERDMYDLIFEDNIYPNFDITDVKMYTCDDFYSASTPHQSNTRSL